MKLTCKRHNFRQLFIKICDWAGLYRHMSDDTYLRKMFYCCFGKDFNLKHPKTFNEKLQWLKLYDRNPEYTYLVDKYEVKSIISSRLGSQYSVPCIGLWDDFSSIDFDNMPNQFVLKTTHDSGSVIICNSKDDFDYKLSRHKLQKSLRRNYYYYRREWPYKNVKPRIIAEPLLINNGKPVDDIKIHCFNGIPKLILVCSDRYTSHGLTEDFYDIDWNHLNIMRPGVPNALFFHGKPPKLNEMIELARKISSGIPFLRVDFFIADNQIYIGELTFFPASGFERFVPDEWDDILGSWLELPPFPASK